MQLFTVLMVLGILMIIFGFILILSIIQLNNKKEIKKHGLNHDADSISLEQARQKKINKDLEKRIQVLESIVTKDNYGLDQKIREL